ncbi:hypothetical protein [Neorhizobium sp. JUb45]|uniref:hypothetical protein n=1 Tax=unclassified Neorhizobium TaxID=2629175 RepID=UPI00104F0AA7|nr:hypothetical protein [Neorhizobium sp. JUb45]TCQ99994.1 hypothetical protein EDF70_10772 [Neorhizobium sp. JUb45]
MTRRTVFAFAVLSGFVSTGPAAHATEDVCAARLAEIVTKAYPEAKALPDNKFEVEGRKLTLPESGYLGRNPQAMLCRTWPARPELTLLAVPLMNEPQQDGMNEGDLDMLVLESKSFDVKQRHRVEGLTSDDAISIEELTFDTAFYQLAPENVAFGLRKMTRGSSRPNPFSDTSLWLFFAEGNQLKPILENFTVYQYRGETDTNCNGEFEEKTRTLSMAPSSKGAIADLLVSEKRANILHEAVWDECRDTEKVITIKHRLRFKDSAYLVPKALQEF